MEGKDRSLLSPYRVCQGNGPLLFQDCDFSLAQARAGKCAKDSCMTFGGCAGVMA